MDLLDRVQALADDAADQGDHALAQALHAVASLGGKPPAAVVHMVPRQAPAMVVGPDMAAVLAFLKVTDVAAFNARRDAAGEAVLAVGRFRYVE
jgi:hypothetical protein